MTTSDTFDTFDFGALRSKLGMDVAFKQWSALSKSSAYPCALCGRSCPNPTHRVRFVNGHLDTVATDAFADRPENQSGDMGGYPVGPACMRKIKKTVAEAEFLRFFAPIRAL